MFLPQKVLVTGSSGFIGRAVCASLTRRPDVFLRVLQRTPPVRRASSTTVIQGDIRDPLVLDRACEGQTTVVHAASYVGHDPDLQESINVTGTRSLVEAAKMHAVSRFIYVSTTGVYGRITPPGGSENDYRPRPESSLNKSRYEAEQCVLASGGIVIRPHLVYGVGDKWFLGALAGFIVRAGVWIDGGETQLSVISVDSLGKAIAGLAVHSPSRSLPNIFHAAYSRPVSLRMLVGELLENVGLDQPTASVSADSCEYEQFGISAGQWSVVTRDNVLNSDRLWALLGEPGEQKMTQAMIGWYRERLGSTTKAY